MKTEHTPGPWIIEHDECALPGHISISSINSDGTFRHSMLAQVVWKMEDDDRSPEKESNARLIAAAPDLLEALQRVLKDIPNVITLEGMSYVEEAISKAKGIV